MGTEPHDHNRDAQYSAPVATGPGTDGVQSTRTLGGGTAPQAQTVV